MQVTGIICECNPFHFGHEKAVRAAKDLGADAVIGVMSGNYVQRGEPACMSKFDRAEAMAKHGFDLVLELPVRFALASSQRFAAAGVRLLDAIGAADTLLFGSECGDQELLREAAAVLCSPDTVDGIRKRQENGVSYPAAQEQILSVVLGQEKAVALRGGNNLLALEYLKALETEGSKLRPVTVRRIEDGLSAHGIRDRMRKGMPLEDTVPGDLIPDYKEYNGPDVNSFSRTCLLRLRDCTETDLARLPDGKGGLDQRIFRAAGKAASLDELFEAVKTRRYTMSRVKRMTLCAVLGLYGSPDVPPPYARILAIGKHGKEILAVMKEASSIPFSADVRVLEASSSLASEMIAEEMRADDFYNLNRKVPVPVGEDCTRRLFVL